MSRSASLECVRYLLNSYSSFPFDVLTENDCTVLHSAIEGGNMDVIQLILDLTRDVDSEAEDKQDKIDSFLNHTNSEGRLSSDDLPYLFE